MRYTGTKYSQTEAEAIMSSARATVRLCENLQQRDGTHRFVTKTLDHARVAEPKPAPQPQQMEAQTASWVEWVDGRIEQMRDFILDTVGQALGELLDKEHASFQVALDKRDRAIEMLRDEIEIKIGLGRKLAKLKAEVAEAQQQAPNFKAELDGLQEQVAKQQKIISRLRGEQSQLAYAQKQLDSEQQKNRQQVSLTAVKLTTIGAQTRTALEALRENGFDLWEMESPSGLMS
jgi:chromosome segregation ATPase